MGSLLQAGMNVLCVR